MRPTILPFGVLLVSVATPVYGKGGGKSSKGSSSSSEESDSSSSGGSSSSSSSKNSGGTHVTVISTGGYTRCYNENDQLIQCPPNSARKNMIIGAVVGGIFGALLLGFLIYWIVMRTKEKRRLREKKPILPSLSFGKQKYKPLESNDTF